jgi:hypothetical protein
MKSKKKHRKKINKGPIYIVLLSFALFFAIIGLIFVGSSARVVNIDDEVIEAGTNYDSNTKFFLFGKDITKSATKMGIVNTGKPGKYNLTYICHFERFNKTVTVVDTQAPKLTLIGQAEMFLTDMDDFVEPGFTAIDKCEGDLTDNVKVSYNKVETDDGTSYDIVYSIEDSSGNKSSATRTVNIIEGTVYEIKVSNAN